jgi:hypothetical protein
MPDTLLALCVLLLLVIPGVVFAVQVDNRLPTRELSSLRELSSVVGVGTICDFIVLIIFGILRTSFPHQTPNVGAIVNSGSLYVKSHYISVGWWAAGLLASSCGLAYVLGRYKPEIAGRVVSGNIRFTSAWWELFNLYPESFVYVGCELQDGSYLSGHLLRYSTEVDETSDRELVLSAPISYRPSGEKAAAILENVGAVTISARQLKFLTVTYTDELRTNGASEDRTLPNLATSPYSRELTNRHSMFFEIRLLLWLPFPASQSLGADLEASQPAGTCICRERLG